MFLLAYTQQTPDVFGRQGMYYFVMYMNDGSTDSFTIGYGDDQTDLNHVQEEYALLCLSTQSGSAC